MRLLIVNRRYCPGEAWTNRVLAYARGFSELGIRVELCYLISDKQRSQYNITIPGVTIVNFWERDGFFGKNNRYVSLLCGLHRLKQYVEPSDSVFVCDGESYIIRTALFKTHNVYVEITEHPFMTGSVEDARLPYLRRVLLNRVKGLFVISKSLKHYFEQNGIDRQRIHISNMFVDAGRFEGQRKLAGEKYFAYCGVVSKYKDGVDTLIKAFAQFHVSHPEYKLYIIGRFVSNEVQKELELMTESLAVTNSVIFTGLVLPEKIPDLLLNAQALVLARPNNVQAKYGFPTKLGEYLATGNPVIVTNVGEIGSFLKDRVNAIVLPPDDTNAFANGMEWVAEHPKEAAVIGQKGQELVKSEFSYKTQSELVCGIISSSSVNL